MEIVTEARRRGRPKKLVAGSEANSITEQPNIAASNSQAQISTDIACCMVKSCPTSEYTFPHLAHANANSIVLGEPCTLVVLPRGGRFSCLDDSPPAIEELRNILADEATVLDAATRSIWRIPVDALTVISTISKLGFRSTHFDISTVSGVHTWVMTHDAAGGDARNLAIHVGSSHAPQTTTTSEPKILKPENNNKVDDVEVSENDEICFAAADSPDDLAPMLLLDGDADEKQNPHVSGDRLSVGDRKARKVVVESTLTKPINISNGIAAGKTKKLETNATNARRKRENSHELAESPLTATQTDDESVSHRRPSLPSSKRPRKDDDDVAPEPDVKKTPVLPDFLDDINAIPLATRQEYNITAESRGLVRSHGPKCICKKTATRNRDFSDCRSNATVCGRRYCHYAVDEVVLKWWLTGEFNTKRLVRLLMNMVFTMNELCCIAPTDGNHYRQKSNGKFVEIPDEYLLDLQQVASGHFDKLLRERAATDDDGGQQPQPSSQFLEEQQQPLLALEGLKTSIRRFLTDTRWHYAHDYVHNKNVRDKGEKKKKKSAKTEE